MTLSQARRAIRKAKRVFASVVFFEGGDAHYVRLTKLDALYMYRSSTDDDNNANLKEVDGDVYID